jgi:hypothetical protein
MELSASSACCSSEGLTVPLEAIFDVANSMLIADETSQAKAQSYPGFPVTGSIPTKQVHPEGRGKPPSHQIVFVR